MWSLSFYKFHAFFILTKYLPDILAVTLRCDGLRCNSKASMNFFFLLHNFMDRKLFCTIEQHTFFFFFTFLIK